MTGPRAGRSYIGAEPEARGMFGLTLIGGCGSESVTLRPLDDAEVRDAMQETQRGPCTPGPTAGSLTAEAWATYVLTGERDVDSTLGFRIAVGDLDEDGRDDLVVTGDRSPEPKVYVVMGERLTAVDPGSYTIAEVASYTITFEAYTSCGGRGQCGELSNVGIHVGAGALYIGNPTHPSLPWAYLIRWPTLQATRHAPRAAHEVAEVLFYQPDPWSWGPNSVGESVQVCDVNGDGEQDLLLAEEHCGFGAPDPGYLALGPFTATTYDLQRRAIPMHDGACALGACRDYNGDGIDDFAVSSRDPLFPDDVTLGIYYGSEGIGTTGVLDLADADVLVLGDNLYSTPESAADWDGDGHVDLLVRTFAHDEGSRSEVSLYRGGPGFHPSGTVLDETDRHGSVVDDASTVLGAGMSLTGDTNGDGWPELLVGRPHDDASATGGLRVRRCPLEPGVHEVSDFADAAISGGPENDSFGGIVRAQADLDGDGLSDIVVGPQSALHPEPGAVYVRMGSPTNPLR